MLVQGVMSGRAYLGHHVRFDGPGWLVSLVHPDHNAIVTCKSDLLLLSCPCAILDHMTRVSGFQSAMVEEALIAQSGPRRDNEQDGLDYLCHTGAVALKVLSVFHEGLEIVPVLPHEGDSVLPVPHMVPTGSLGSSGVSKANLALLVHAASQTRLVSGRWKYLELSRDSPEKAISIGFHSLHAQPILCQRPRTPWQ